MCVCGKFSQSPEWSIHERNDYSNESRLCFVHVSGYENQDWYIPPPSERITGTEALTSEQTKETLNYFRE